MCKNRTSIYLIIICIFFSFPIQAQNYKKTNISGKEFYQYQVEKSEGFYSITRKFGVTQEELINQNPELKDGLKVGQTILIPVKAGYPIFVPKPVVPVVPEVYVEHVVKKKETVFSISQMYGINIDTIYKYNPETVRSLKKGTIVKFPASSVKKNKQKEAENVNYNLHTVQPKETLYSISRKYNISQKELLALNPTLENVFIREGDVLRISKKTLSDSFSIENDSLLADTTSTDSIIPKTSLKVAFLLPFMLDSEKYDSSADKFIEFYQGALIAIDSLKKQGLSVDVFVYDTDKSEEKIKSILLKPELKKVDFIIGPAYTVQVKEVADFAMRNKVRLIIPFSSKTDETFTNPYIYQCNTYQAVLDQIVAKDFANRFKDRNIVILKFKDGHNEIENFSNYLFSELDTLNISYKSQLITAYDSAHVIPLNDFMVNDKENLVLLLTTNSSTLARMMPLLNTLINKDFSLFGFPEWHQLAKTQEDIFSHNTYIYSSFYLDYSNPDIRRFFRTYTEAFGKETPKSLPHYNLLGYDITFYFLSGMKNYGNAMERHLSDLNVNTMQSKYLYEKVAENGGYMNKGIFLLKYKDGKENKIK